MVAPVQNFNIENKHYSVSELNKEGVKEELKKRPLLIKNDTTNSMQIGWDKLTNALSVYPARGLKGSRNSNFYEFLTMGMFPYLTGSLTLMAVFNGAKNLFSSADARNYAGKIGKKMALGVVFYGLAKNISQGFVTKPVKWFTGVDTEEPYAVLAYKLPEHKNDTDIADLEYHKVLESLDFPRWDVKYGDDSKGIPRNFWFDHIAKKIGLGYDLKDSDQEVKPRVKEIAVKTNLAKTFSSYLWAAVGVGLSAQNTWDEFFKVATWKVWKGKDFLNTIGLFADSLFNSAIELYKGNPEPKAGFLKKHSGKMLLALSALSTVTGITNVLISKDKPAKIDSADIIDKDRKYVVN